MCGHAAPAITAAVRRQMESGATLLLPTLDAQWVGEELARRFRVPYWGFTTSATDANRAAIRIARMVTGRDVVLVFNGCYHGSVEEAHVCLAGGTMAMRSGVHPNAVDHERVSRVVEFNDLAALEAALAPGDVALVLAEPCMTNYGMIEAQPGFMAALRELTRRTGTLLLLDETHTWSAGPGGYTGRDRLEPDFVVLGKAAGGGIPVGLYGLSESVAQRLWEIAPREGSLPKIRQSSHMGFGGTLAGSGLQVAAVRAVLGEVLTEAAFRHMIALATVLASGIRSVISATGMAWFVAQSGARVEIMLAPEQAHQRLGRCPRAQRHARDAVPCLHAEPGDPGDTVPQHAPGVSCNRGARCRALRRRLRCVLRAAARAAVKPASREAAVQLR